MALMIPDIDGETIENNGERLFYQAARRLPDEYTVLYSYRYRAEELLGEEPRIGEADFVIVHPEMGYVVVEVKQGEIAYIKGTWYELKDGGYQPLHKDPVEQAQRAMYAILSRYKERAGTHRFSLRIRYAICFPECNEITGFLPADLDERSIILFRDLENLDTRLRSLFGRSIRAESRAVDILIGEVLAPAFRAFANLEHQIEMLEKASARVLTEEQERILQETELDRRKIFFGAAGTGKTFLAVEKAKRLAASGRRVLLTCYNRNLARHLNREDRGDIELTIANFHDYLLDELRERGFDLRIPDSGEERSEFFNVRLPTLGFDHFASLPEEKKFDSIIVDEGQDFRELWYDCLESMVKKGGEFYVFADPNQNLFNANIDYLKRFDVSKHRLTVNLRNTEAVNKWMSRFIAEGAPRSLLRGGLPVRSFEWRTPAEERKLIKKEAGRLVSQGIKPGRIMILSPNVKEKSSLAGMDRIREWPLVPFDENKVGAVKFATIRSFKGLEADIVFLIGIKRESRVCSTADLYVGGSRARFILYIFRESGEAVC